ncbi:hypothetical protein ACFSKL_18240 [Belliella marina]|uniref:LemA protein n=1 Tax=Belliella marina TaxID=1644146 RepID=A0ABW4VV41_9BACT
MGFIPIILTLSGAIMLFLMVVYQSLQSKKKQFEIRCKETWSGMAKINPEILEATPNFEKIQSTYKTIKSELRDDQLGLYNTEIKRPLQEAKLIRIHFNNLISKKPYSFVVRIFNIQPI